MTIKKMLLLASMALAAVAFAAPAAAQASPEWLLNGATLNGEEEFHIEGELSSNVIGSAVVSGPCEVTFTGTAKNVNGMADGAVEAGTISKTCSVAQIPGCSFEPTLNNLGEGNKWPLTGTTVTGVNAVEIQSASFTNHYNATCVAAGLPATVTATGTATGIVAGSECLSFEGHNDDLFMVSPPTGLQININGEVCLTEGPLTLG
jgi:hypothetical protein